jgi:hypothetical protein
LERSLGEITNATDFKGWVVGFYGQQWKALAGVASMIADAQTAKWQAKYGKDPTDQQHVWLVNKVHRHCHACDQGRCLQTRRGG